MQLEVSFWKEIENCTSGCHIYFMIWYQYKLYTNSNICCFLQNLINDSYKKDWMLFGNSYMREKKFKKKKRIWPLSSKFTEKKLEMIIKENTQEKYSILHSFWHMRLAKLCKHLMGNSKYSDTPFAQTTRLDFVTKFLNF